MKYFLLALIMGCSQMTPKNTETEFSCPGQLSSQIICLLNEGDQIVAVNTGKENVAVVLRVIHIKNIELKYRYPFIEFLAPGTSKVLLNYRRKKMNQPYAFDYDWHWRVAL